MKYFLVIVLIFVSINIFAHDFTWGQSRQQLINKNGTPDSYNDLNNLYILTYRHATFIRNYMFSSDGLIYVQDFYRPFFDPSKVLIFI